MALLGFYSMAAAACLVWLALVIRDMRNNYWKSKFEELHKEMHDRQFRLALLSIAEGDGQGLALPPADSSCPKCLREVGEDD